MPNKVPFSKAIIDLCLPFKLNIAVIGKTKSGKTSYIEGIVKILTDKTMQLSESTGGQGEKMLLQSLQESMQIISVDNITNTTNLTSSKKSDGGG
jgi:ABC-type microcin C transport system duplicated ATPase subunit YejF